MSDTTTTEQNEGIPVERGEPVKIKKEEAPVESTPTVEETPLIDVEDAFISFNESMGSDIDLNDIDPTLAKRHKPRDYSFTPSFASEKPVPDDQIGKLTYHLKILNGNLSDFLEAVAKMPRTELEETEGGTKWLRNNLEASQVFIQGNSFQDSLRRTGSKWSQRGKHPVTGSPFGAGRRNLGKPGSWVASAGGDLAGYRIQNAVGKGFNIDVPLWASGFWVSLRPASSAELADLHTEITKDKEKFGRATAGSIFSNATVFTTIRIINFIIDHIHETNFHSQSREDLLKAIKVPDLNALFTYMAATQWQDGFPYKRICNASPGECNHEREAMLMLSSLVVTDFDLISEDQMRHMADIKKRQNQESVDKYLAGFSHLTESEYIHINDTLSIRLQLPAMEDYRVSGYDWINGIINQVDRSLSVRLDERDRNNYIQNQSKLTKLRLYAHWIAAFCVNGEEETSREVIEKQLILFSTDPVISTKILEGIIKYIEASTLSVVAVAKEACDVCKKDYVSSEELKKYPELTALDPVSTFFTLLDRHLAQLYGQQ